MRLLQITKNNQTLLSIITTYYETRKGPTWYNRDIKVSQYKVQSHYNDS